MCGGTEGKCKQWGALGERNSIDLGAKEAIEQINLYKIASLCSIYFLCQYALSIEIRQHCPQSTPSTEAPGGAVAEAPKPCHCSS